MEKVFESMSYVQLAMVVCGQLVMGLNTVLASTLFFLGNCIAVSRCFVLCRPMSDKIKDICLLLISVVSFVLSII
jgi:hypothetical protein